MDIVKRLRADAEATDDIGLCADAADEIEKLRKLLRFVRECDTGTGKRVCAECQWKISEALGDEK